MPSARGTLPWTAAADCLDLLAPPVSAAVQACPSAEAAPIDDTLADTAAFCAAYEVAPEASANCVIVAGRRGERETLAAVLVLATHRADVNGVIRRHLDVRKISFAPREVATVSTGMEFGGITPIGLPPDWPILIDRAVLEAGPVVVGSGLRRSKLLVNAADLATLPGAQVLDLATLVEPLR